MFEKSSGVTIKFTDASQSFDTLIRPRVQGNNPPDIALFPQPGLMLDFAKQGKIQDLSAMLNLDQLKTTLVPGELDAGTLGRQDLRRAHDHEREEPGLVPEEGLRGQGLHRSRPPSPSSRRSPTRSRPTAPRRGVSASSRPAPPAGWAPTGSRTSCCATAAPRSTTSGSSTRSPSPTRWSCRPAQEFEKLALADGNVFGGRKSGREHQLRHRDQPHVRRPAQVLPAPAGQLHHPEGLHRREGPAPTWTKRSACSSCRASDAADKPVLGGGDLAGAFSNDDDAKKVDGVH